MIHIFITLYCSRLFDVIRYTCHKVARHSKWGSSLLLSPCPLVSNMVHIGTLAQDFSYYSDHCCQVERQGPRTSCLNFHFFFLHFNPAWPREPELMEVPVVRVPSSAVWSVFQTVSWIEPIFDRFGAGPRETCQMSSSSPPHPTQPKFEDSYGYNILDLRYFLKNWPRTSRRVLISGVGRRNC